MFVKTELLKGWNGRSFPQENKGEERRKWKKVETVKQSRRVKERMKAAATAVNRGP